MAVEFHPRAPLTDPGWFFGRQDELRRLFSYLNSASPQNVSIVGQRRIGKSWLLKVVALDGALRAKYLSDPDRYTFIYWDLQREPSLAPELFFERLIELLVRHLPSELKAECKAVIVADDPEESLAEILELLEVAEHRVVLLLDEFAAITRNTAFAETFFSHLRSIFNQPTMTCVTASYLSLGKMCHLGPDSPFFNIFSRIQLKLFNDAEAKAFVAEPFRARGITVDGPTAKAILRLTGSHPCFISQLCHELLHEGNTTLTETDIERHNGSFQMSIFDDFSYYWQRLEEDEQAMLRNIASGNAPSTTENPVYIHLEELSLVTKQKGRSTPFSIPFGQFIKERKGTDVYFERAFASANLDGPNFIRLCEIVLSSASHMPDPVCNHLAEAIRAMQGRPQEAMRICGRDVLDPLFVKVHQAEWGSRWGGDQYETCRLFDDRADQGHFPKHLAAHFQSIRISGNHGAHPYKYGDACTPARAFLTVLETIHLAEEVYKRYGT